MTKITLPKYSTKIVWVVYQIDTDIKTTICLRIFSLLALFPTCAASKNNDDNNSMMTSELPPPASSTVYKDPLDDPELYPEYDCFMKALQDPGERNTKNNEIVYKQLMKSVASIQKVLVTKYRDIGVPKNQTDCRRQIVLSCVRSRKSRDKGLLPEKFRKFALPNSNTVFILNDDEIHGGFRIVLSACISHWKSQKKRAFDSRNSNDACRVAAILLDPKHRDSVSRIMSNKKDRAMQDQSACPVKAFYEVAAEDFRSIAYRAKLPLKFNLIEGHESIDPNDSDRILLDGRDGIWLKATWDDYLRPKYRKILDKWFSDTGGGGGLLENFQNYCRQEKWLTYVFMLDSDVSFLLAANAKSIVPEQLCNESGYFKKDSGDPSTLTSRAIVSSNSMKGKVASALKTVEENQSNIAQCVTLMTTMLEQRAAAATPSSNANTGSAAYLTPSTLSSTPLPRKRSLVDVLEEAEKLRAHERIIKNDDIFSPNTKNALVAKIQEERKAVLKMAAFGNDNKN